MSSSIAIPKRKKKPHSSGGPHHHHSVASASAATAYSPSSFSSTPRSSSSFAPSSAGVPATAAVSSIREGKRPVGQGSGSHSSHPHHRGRRRDEEGCDETGGEVGGWERRRPSLLSTSISRSEHSVISISGPDDDDSCAGEDDDDYDNSGGGGYRGGSVLRLIASVKAGQGFDWNQEMFLPSYLDHDSGDLERRQDPVEDIVLTEEEAASMFPQ